MSWACRTDGKVRVTRFIWLTSTTHAGKARTPASVRPWVSTKVECSVPSTFGANVGAHGKEGQSLSGESHQSQTVGKRVSVLRSDSYTIFSLISGSICILAVFLPGIGAGTRVMSLLSGVLIIGYAVWVDQQTSGTYYYSVYIFALPAAVVLVALIKFFQWVGRPSSSSARQSISPDVAHAPLTYSTDGSHYWSDGKWDAAISEDRDWWWDGTQWIDINSPERQWWDGTKWCYSDFDDTTRVAGSANPPLQEPSDATPRGGYCSACGAIAEPNDHYCEACGNALVCT